MKIKSDKNFLEFLKKAYVLQLKEGSFSAVTLARETGKSYGYTSKILTEMAARGLIKQIRQRRMLGSGGRSNLKGFSPSEYVLLKTGRRKVRVVLTGGVFDIIHPGHIAMITESKNLGDSLVVVIARDSTVKRRKGRSPGLSEQQRLSVVSSLRFVDVALPGSSRSFNETIRGVNPDVVALGYDQDREMTYMKKFIKRSGRRIEIVRIGKTIPRLSSSIILNRIKAR